MKSLRTCVQRLERRYHSSDQHERLFTLKKDGRRKEIENNVAAIANLISSLPKKENGKYITCSAQNRSIKSFQTKKMETIFKKKKKEGFLFYFVSFFFLNFWRAIGLPQ